MLTVSIAAVDMMLDCDELPLADAPVSWSAGKGIQFLLFTVNHTKVRQPSITLSLNDFLNLNCELYAVPACCM